MNDAADFFASHGRMTDPGEQTRLFEYLPGDVSALVRIVQGLMIHIFWADQYGVQLTDERRGEVQLRSINRKLERILELDPRPLGEARLPESRLVGNCRDFSVMLTAMLRYQGISARARCGFARYFIPDHYEDHWVVEYWNTGKKRWVLVDAQLDALQRNKLAIQFDPLDVPRDQFIVGGKAWQLCRQGEADPDTFGIFDLKGLWFVRGDFVRDVASLNKLELLPWDSWGIIEAPDEAPSSEDLSFLDGVAELVSSDVPQFSRLRQLYESDDRLRVPGIVHAYTQGGVQDVDLEQV